MIHTPKKPKLSRREREREARRQMILDAANTVFMRDGYHKATIAEIAALAEFGIGTIYQFFPHKQCLFEEVIIRDVELFMQGLRDSIADQHSLPEKLEAYIRYRLQSIEEHPEVYKMIMEIFASPIPDTTSNLMEYFKRIHLETSAQLHEILAGVNMGDREIDLDLVNIGITGSIDRICDNFNMGILNKKPTDYSDALFSGIMGIINALGGTTND